MVVMGRTHQSTATATKTERVAFHAILADRACRETLAALEAEGDGPTSLAALASDVGPLGPGGQRDAAVHLHHVTLPKLEDAGLVDYDPDERTVRSTRDELDEASLDRVGGDPR